MTSILLLLFIPLAVGLIVRKFNAPVKVCVLLVIVVAVAKLTFSA